MPLFSLFVNTQINAFNHLQRDFPSSISGDPQCSYNEVPALPPGSAWFNGTVPFRRGKEARIYLKSNSFPDLGQCFLGNGSGLFRSFFQDFLDVAFVFFKL